MPGDREQELKRRLASVLWDAVEECVQRLDAESVSEKVRKWFICGRCHLPDPRVYEQSSVKEMPAGGEHSVFHADILASLFLS